MWEEQNVCPQNRYPCPQRNNLAITGSVSNTDKPLMSTCSNMNSLVNGVYYNNQNQKIPNRVNYSDIKILLGDSKARVRCDNSNFKFN